MPRSKDINTYSAPERALLSPEVHARLPQSIGKFSTKKEANALRLSIYGLIGAGKRSTIYIEQINAMNLGVSNAYQLPDGSWTIDIYDKNVGYSGAGSKVAAAITDAVLSITGGVMPNIPTAGEAGPGDSVLGDPFATLPADNLSANILAHLTPGAQIAPIDPQVVALRSLGYSPSSAHRHTAPGSEGTGEAGLGDQAQGEGGESA